MSNNTNQPPPSSPTQYSSSLSLSLAGIFRRAEAEAEEGRDRRGVDVVVDAAAVEISSENSGLVGRSSEDWFEGLDDHHDDVDVAEEEGDDDDDDGKSERKKKKRKYQRHTAEQIREMEAVFKHTPHPDEKQREQLSKQLGLSQRQVKFWFQNRRTQIKAFQERHESSIQKLELDKLREENKGLRETINKACCPNCGMANTNTTATPSYSEVHRLRLENAKLRAEIEKLGSTLKGKTTTTTTTTSTTSPSSSTCNEETENIRGLEFYSGIPRVDHEKRRIMERVKEAMEELIKMATMGEPLWVHSVERGREILNYDEYLKQFSVQNNERPKRLSNVEASRGIGDVLLDLPRLLQIFLDVNKWKEMFPCLISKAATLDVICSGEGANRNGAVQLMYSEMQMVTPMVARREVYYVRYCKKINEQDWGVVDVSILELDPKALKYCIKRPSGCILHPYSTGRCKVIWVEHVECEKRRVPTMYRTIVNSGVAFGANHWLATLQLQCERLLFFMATNVPIQDSTGGVTVAGRKSILKLGQRMTESFCQAVGGCSSLNNNNSWSKFRNDKGEEIWIQSRKNMNDPGEPLGLILCAVSSFWLPLSPNFLFAFLMDQGRRTQWDMTIGDGSVQSIASLAKGQDPGNAVTIQEVKSKDSSSSSRWIVQDSSRNAYESMVVYAPVNFILMQSVITGCDSSNLPILPSGFSILPDGHGEIRPLLITSNHQEKNTTEEEEGGSFITMAFQVLVSTSFDATLTKESVESVNNVLSCTLTNIRKNLQCEDG